MKSLKDMQFVTVIGRHLENYSTRKLAEKRAIVGCNRGIRTAVIECKIVSVHHPTKKAIRKRKERIKIRFNRG